MWILLPITLGVFLLAVIGMAIGVMVSGKRLKGSCGGAVGPNGEVVGDCLCARTGKTQCETRQPAASREAEATSSATR
ncbi:MAG: (Na+)-NQR maturation NqrM [Planctomycetota bacterium]